MFPSSPCWRWVELPSDQNKTRDHSRSASELLLKKRRDGSVIVVDLIQRVDSGSRAAQLINAPNGTLIRCQVL